MERYDHLAIDVARPIVFLDLDGVINNYLYRYPWYRKGMGYKSVAHDYYYESMATTLGLVLNEFNCQVVIVSSWLHPYVEHTSDKAKLISSILCNVEVLGSINTSHARAESIERCVDHHSIPNWLVIDDSYQMYESNQRVYDELIIIHGRYGLQAVDFEKIHEVLSKKI